MENNSHVIWPQRKIKCWCFWSQFLISYLLKGRGEAQQEDWQVRAWWRQSVKKLSQWLTSGSVQAGAVLFDIESFDVKIKGCDGAS